MDVKLTYVITDDCELFQVVDESEVMTKLEIMADLGFEVKVEYLQDN